VNGARDPRRVVYVVWGRSAASNVDAAASLGPPQCRWTFWVSAGLESRANQLEQTSTSSRGSAWSSSRNTAPTPGRATAVSWVTALTLQEDPPFRSGSAVRRGARARWCSTGCAAWSIATSGERMVEVATGLALRADQVDFFGVAVEQGDTDLSPLRHGGRRGGDLGAGLGTPSSAQSRRWSPR
jgi:hypothetical protein